LFWKASSRAAAVLLGGWKPIDPIDQILELLAFGIWH